MSLGKLLNVCHLHFLHDPKGPSSLAFFCCRASRKQQKSFWEWNGGNNDKAGDRRRREHTLSLIPPPRSTYAVPGPVLTLKISLLHLGTPCSTGTALSPPCRGPGNLTSEKFGVCQTLVRTMQAGCLGDLPHLATSPAGGPGEGCGGPHRAVGLGAPSELLGRGLMGGAILLWVGLWKLLFFFLF